MTRRHLRIGFVVFLMTLLSWALPARAAYVPPPIAGHVTDTAHKLSSREVAALNEKLARYRKCSDNHVAVFLPRSLEGNAIEDVAHVTFNRWKVGAAKKDNGVLLVLAPAERKIRIEVGKGVEGDLTDLESSRILRETVIPNLKADRFFAAADQATTRIANALGGCSVVDVGRNTVPAYDPLSEPVSAPTSAPAPASSWPEVPYLPMKILPPPNEHLPERYEMAAGLAVLVLLASIGLRAYAVGMVGSVIAGIMSFTFMSAIGRPAYDERNFKLDDASALFFIAAVLLVCITIGVWAHRWKYGVRSSVGGWSSSGSDGTSTSTSTSTFSSSAVDWSSSSSSVGGSSSSSSSSGYDSSSSSGSSSSSDYSGGGGSSGGGGASDSY